MIEVRTQAAQGDCLLRRIEKVPANAVKQPTRKGENVIVSHSETGHHHVVMFDPSIEHFSAGDPLVSYLTCDNPMEVVHQRDYDTHESLRLGAGTWEVRRQREWAPEGWRRVAD